MKDFFRHGVEIKFTCENTLNLQDLNRINILTDVCWLLVIIAFQAV